MNGENHPTEYAGILLQDAEKFYFILYFSVFILLNLPLQVWYFCKISKGNWDYVQMKS